MNIIKLNDELATVRQFLAIYEGRERDLLAKIAEATLDADKIDLDYAKAKGMTIATPQQVDEVRTKRARIADAEVRAEVETKDAIAELLKEKKDA